MGQLDRIRHVKRYIGELIRDHETGRLPATGGQVKTLRGVLPALGELEENVEHGVGRLRDHMRRVAP